MSKTAGVDYATTKKLVLKALADGGTTVAAVAKEHGISEGSVHRWQKLASKKPRASKKRKVKPARAAKNGKATNGHALPPPSVPSLDLVRAQLTDALHSVDQLRAAYRSVFGGAA